ncbi:hypothetical protein ACLB2K_011568 [Fragaria x ananassa]
MVLVQGLVIDHGSRHPDMKRQVENCYVLTTNVYVEYEKRTLERGGGGTLSFSVGHSGLGGRQNFRVESTRSENRTIFPPSGRPRARHRRLSAHLALLDLRPTFKSISSCSEQRFEEKIKNPVKSGDPIGSPFSGRPRQLHHPRFEGLLSYINLSKGSKPIQNVEGESKERNFES